MNYTTFKKVMEPSKTIETLQSGLEPYIKPREQVNYIRRILALQLGSYASDGKLSQPLALPKTPQEVPSGPFEAKGIYKDFLEALQSNAAARQKFEDVLDTKSEPERSPSPAIPASDEYNLLEAQVEILKLQQKKQKLSAVQKYIDDIFEKPAALPSFLAKDQLFNGAAELPEVPEDVVKSIATEKGATSVDINSQEIDLEKTLLRARLLLKEEEKLLKQARMQSQNNPDVLSTAAKITALYATRNELIAWMESELSAAGSDETGESPNKNTKGSGDLKATQATLANDLLQIKQKYSRYCSLRRDILASLAQTPQPMVAPDLTAKRQLDIVQASNLDIDYLLTPYVERLLSISRRQKALIAQKAHANAALSQRAKNAGKTFDRLADESQLLPAHSNEASSGSRSGLIDDSSSRKLNLTAVSDRIRPWVFAADSAKLGSLESVTEIIEGGQLALENSAKSLHDINSLLGLTDPESENKGVEEQEEDDFWMSPESSSKTARQHTDKQQPERKKGDIWSALHGDLGVIGKTN